MGEKFVQIRLCGLHFPLPRIGQDDLLADQDELLQLLVYHCVHCRDDSLLDLPTQAVYTGESGL